jgi:hypothetical protein
MPKRQATDSDIKLFRNFRNTFVNFLILFSVVAPTPKTSDLKILSGPDFIYLDWPVPEEGWASDFSIDIELMNSTLDDEFEVGNSKSVDIFTNVDSFTSIGNISTIGNFTNVGNSTNVGNLTNIGSKRTYRSSIVPPFNVSHLIPEHQYKIVITTNLNDKWKTTLVLEDVFTTANNSKLPEEIIGVSLTTVILLIFSEEILKNLNLKKFY